MHLQNPIASEDEAGGSDDLDRLFREFSGRLALIVRMHVRAPDAAIEDACQFAWSRLVHHRARVCRETAMGWLVRTAIREALKLSRRAGRDLSLDAALELGLDPVATAPGPQELFEHRERLAAVTALRPRQQRILWLRALGLSHLELAERERCTPRTVQRELADGRRCLRAAAR
jgi:RNA polymerase sigma factor (sigma-70 family)